MKVVLDTNILVSGLLQPFSAAGDIVRMVARGELHLSYDARILWEYKEVLGRARFSFEEGEVEDLLEQVEASGSAVAAGPLLKRLPDPDDEPFLEVALAGQVSCLVTGNLKHYPLKRRGGMRVVSPREFLEEWRKKG